MLIAEPLVLILTPHGGLCKIGWIVQVMFVYMFIFTATGYSEKNVVLQSIVDHAIHTFIKVMQTIIKQNVTYSVRAAEGISDKRLQGQQQG